MRADESITGLIRTMRIVRDGWGYAQVAIEADDSEVAMVGTLLGFGVGETIEARGAWTHHATYGLQFKARTIRTLARASGENYVAWLVSLEIPNFGPKRCAAIVEHLGSSDAAHEVFLESPGRLAEVRGVSAQTASEAAIIYREHHQSRAEMEAFYACGLTANQIVKIKKVWPTDALERIREDPYQLIEHVDGFGFKRADEVALKIGIPREHPSRIGAALEHVLEEEEREGHTYLPSGKLVGKACELLDVDACEVRPQLERLAGELRVIDRKGWIFSRSMDAAEDSVARAVAAMVKMRDDDDNEA
jgi:exodeoxyribonuclease V alpha subunit